MVEKRNCLGYALNKAGLTNDEIVEPGKIESQFSRIKRTQDITNADLIAVEDLSDPGYIVHIFYRDREGNITHVPMTSAKAESIDFDEVLKIRDTSLGVYGLLYYQVKKRRFARL